MTTIAFDGTTIAADTLVTDAWGLKDRVSKILRGPDFVAGGAGEYGQIMRWWEKVKALSFTAVLEFGYVPPPGPVMRPGANDHLKFKSLR